MYGIASAGFAQEENQQETNEQSEQENQQEGEGTEGEQDTDDGDQGTEESDQDTPEDNSLAGLKRQWVELNKELDTQQIAFDEAEEDTRADEQAKYEEMIGKAHELVEKIKEAAIAELAEASDKQPIFETLLGIMINDATFSKDAEIMRVGKLLIDNGIDKEYFDKASKAERLSLPSRAYFEELTAQLEQKDVVLPQVKIATSKGDIVVELFEIEAPDTVGNFISLVESNFYDGLTFHRVLDGFMAQGGCPNGDGSGDAGYSIFSEYENEGARNHFAGSISMANSGKDTGGTQFFLCFVRPLTPPLDGKHTVFGRVVEGMDVLDKLQRIDPNDPNKPDPDTIIGTEVIRKTEGKEYKPNIVPGTDERGGDGGSDDDGNSDGGADDGDSDG